MLTTPKFIVTSPRLLLSSTYISNYEFHIIFWMFHIWDILNLDTRPTPYPATWPSMVHSSIQMLKPETPESTLTSPPSMIMKSVTELHKVCLQVSLSLLLNLIGTALVQAIITSHHCSHLQAGLPESVLALFPKAVNFFSGCKSDVTPLPKFFNCFLLCLG